MVMGIQTERGGTMGRREVIAFAGTALFAWPLDAHAQQQAKIARLGYLGFGIPAASAPRVEALRAGLRDLGYIEGKNLASSFVGRARSSRCTKRPPSWLA
jgi:hypothetical protein